MLAAGPPTVSNVLVSSTGWTSSFTGYLETSGLGSDGYSIPVGSAAQLNPLPWFNLDQIKIVFSEDVVVESADLALTGANTTQYDFGNFSYDPLSFTATWTLTSPIGNDQLLIDLDSDGIDPVVDASGNYLDGDWIDGASTYNSGDGAEGADGAEGGGDFEFRFNVVPGDVNQSGGVFGDDVLITQAAEFESAGMSGYSIFSDVDGSGSILSDDLVSVQVAQFTIMPSGDPAGVSNDAPTALAIPDVNVRENAVDEVISLFDYFDDLEDLDTDLTYEIVQNSNPQLFDSTNIDSGTGNLTLNFASGQIGSVALMVRVTDSGGLAVETPLNVDVAVNNPPEIIDFVGSAGPSNFWTFTGTVVDEAPEGLTITFGGILPGHSVITEAGGSFSYTLQLDPGVYGTVTAQTQDEEGLESGLVWFLVDLV